MYYMRKFVFALVALAVSTGALAQDVDGAYGPGAGDSKAVMLNQFKHNWDLGVGFGAFGVVREDWRAVGALDISLVKWASPVIGAGLKTDWALDFGKNDFFSLTSANAFVNLCNLFGGYKPERVFDLVGYAGGGVVFPTTNSSNISASPAFTGGLGVQFRISSAVALNLGVDGAVVSDRFNGWGSPDSHPMDGLLGASIGVVCRLGHVVRRNHYTGETSVMPWVQMDVFVDTSPLVDGKVEKAVTAAIGLEREAADGVISSIEHDLLDAQAEIDRVNEEKVEIARSAGKYWTAVRFRIDTWELLDREDMLIRAAADYIKSTPGVKYIVRGFGDEQAEYVSYNEMLGHNRADLVMKALVSYGVDPSQLEMEYVGETTKLRYEGIPSQRSVIIFKQ